MDINKEDHIVTLPKKGLKTRPYSMDMNKENCLMTLPKKGLKTRSYNIGKEKRDLKTRPYSIAGAIKSLKYLSAMCVTKVRFFGKKNWESCATKSRLFSGPQTKKLMFVTLTKHCPFQHLRS